MIKKSDIDGKTGLTWVQDVSSVDADKTILDFNCRFINRPKCSKYIIGLSKNGKTGYVGIYFDDPVITGG